MNGRGYDVASPSDFTCAVISVDESGLITVTD